MRAASSNMSLRSQAEMKRLFSRHAVVYVPDACLTEAYRAHRARTRDADEPVSCALYRKPYPSSSMCVRARHWLSYLAALKLPTSASIPLSLDDPHLHRSCSVLLRRAGMRMVASYRAIATDRWLARFLRIPAASHGLTGLSNVETGCLILSRSRRITFDSTGGPGLGWQCRYIDVESRQAWGVSPGPTRIPSIVSCDEAVILQSSAVSRRFFNTFGLAASRNVCHTHGCDGSSSNSVPSAVPCVRMRFSSAGKGCLPMRGWSSFIASASQHYPTHVSAPAASLISV
ncbi:hypothetical protein DENSPDRAFT_146924 [Dentipellis sp. KUC8613]|nr:hypothetical protein DENSPDRAFT_146924 [Dentipellis sp. KUC8613]